MIIWWVKTWFSPCRHNFNVTAVNLVIMMHKLHQINVGAFHQITSAVVSICPADEIFSCFLTGAERTCDLVAFFFLSFKLQIKKKLLSLKVQKCYKGKTFLLTFLKDGEMRCFQARSFQKTKCQTVDIIFFSYQFKGRASLTTHLFEFFLDWWNLFFSFFQVIGLLDVFTPATTLEGFNDV